MTAAERLAEWISSSDFSDEHAARASVHDAVIDTIGCMFAGWRDPVCQKALNAARQWGTGQLTIIARSEKLPPPSAAFVNGTSAHALDFDDCEVAASTHNSAAIVPALLALAEMNGNSFEDVVDGYIAGFETIVRIGEAVGYGHYTTGWHATSTTGAIGAAAACARLLGLNQQATTNAIIIAATMAAGLKIHFGTDTKPVHAGLAAKNGISAAQLAASGITADKRALDGPGGFCEIFNMQPSPGFDAPLAKLGGRLAIDEYGILTKAYPSCSYTHRPIDAMLELRPKIGDPQNIAQLSISVPQPFEAVAGKRQPRTPPEARFSIAWCLATAAIEGNVRIEHFEDVALTRSDLRDLEQRVEVITYVPPSGLSDLAETAPDTLDVKLADGTCLQSVMGKVRGSPSLPMTGSDRQAKFADCLSHHTSQSRANQIYQSLQNFDDGRDVAGKLASLTL